MKVHSFIKDTRSMERNEQAATGRRITVKASQRPLPVKTNEPLDEPVPETKRKKAKKEEV